MNLRRVSTLPVLGGLTLLYFAVAKLSLLNLAFINASAASVWPVTGISIAALVLFGFRVWPAIFLGAFLVNLTTPGSVATSFAIGAGNALEALCAAWLINRLAGGLRAFDRAP